MNILEEAQVDLSGTLYNGLWTPFDQFAVAVAWDRSCVKKSTNYKVNVHAVFWRVSKATIPLCNRRRYCFWLLCGFAVGNLIRIR